MRTRSVLFVVLCLGIGRSASVWETVEICLGQIVWCLAWGGGK